MYGSVLSRDAANFPTGWKDSEDFASLCLGSQADGRTARCPGMSLLGLKLFQD